MRVQAPIKRASKGFYKGTYKWPENKTLQVFFKVNYTFTPNLMVDPEQRFTVTSTHRSRSVRFDGPFHASSSNLGIITF